MDVIGKCDQCGKSITDPEDIGYMGPKDRASKECDAFMAWETKCAECEGSPALGRCALGASVARRYLKTKDDDCVSPLTLDGYDDCVIGLASRHGQPDLIAYDVQKIVKVLMERDGMEEDEAWEFFRFNIAQAWMGGGTPLLVNTETTLEDIKEMQDEL